MDYTVLFYWLTVADSVRTFAIIMSVIFGVTSAIAIITRFVTYLEASDGREVDRKTVEKCNKWQWRSTPWFILFCSLALFTPSRRDALLIVAGGQTLNFLSNDESAKQIPSELSSFVLTELKNMARESEMDLNITDQKQKVLESVKNMSAEELIEKLKEDETLKEILIDK